AARILARDCRAAATPAHPGPHGEAGLRRDRGLSAVVAAATATAHRRRPGGRGCARPRVPRARPGRDERPAVLRRRGKAAGTHTEFIRARPRLHSPGDVGSSRWRWTTTSRSRISARPCEASYAITSLSRDTTVWLLSATSCC